MPTLPPLRSVTSSWPDDGAHDRGRATRSRHLCREVPVSIDVFFTQPVDYLIGYDGTPASKWTKAKKDLIISNLFRVNIVRMRQTAPSKFREDSAGGLTFPSCQFLGSQQNIVVDVKCGSHAPDAYCIKLARAMPIGVQRLAFARYGSGFGIRGSDAVGEASRFASFKPKQIGSWGFAARRSPFADTVRIRSSGILLGWRHQRPALLLQNRAEATTDRLTFAA